MELGLQPEVVQPGLHPSAGVDYLKAQESGKPGGEYLVCARLRMNILSCHFVQSLSYRLNSSDFNDP